MKVRTSVLKGFALLALSTFTFAACEDKTEEPPVVLPVEVVVVPSTATVQVGQTTPLVAIVNNATNTNVTWSTSTASVATVSATGVVTGVAPGTAIITATSAQDGTKRGVSVVTVVGSTTNVQIQLVPASAGVAIGGTVQLVPLVTGTTNTAVTYSTSAASVATVSASGLVTGVSAGTAVITATSAADPTKQAASVITVAGSTQVVNVSITPTQSSVGVGGTQQFVATVTGSTNTAVTWSTSDPNIATVSSTGLATGVGQGTAVITARSVADNTKSAQATLTVVGASVAISSVPASPASGNFTIITNVQVPAGTADSLVIRLTNGAGQTFQIRCQTFTAAGAATTVNCPINPADIDPNTPGAQILPNDTYTIQAVLLRQNQVAATATFGQQLTTNNANTVNGVVMFDNSLVDNDNDADSNTDVSGTGVVWNGGAATVTLTPSIFQGNAVSTIQVVVDLNCNAAADVGEPIRTATVSGGTASVTFPESGTTQHIDNIEQTGVCFALVNARDANNVTVQLAPVGAGTGNVITGGTTLQPVPGAGQNQFNIDNVEPANPGAAMTLDGADFDGLTTGAYVGSNSTLTATGSNPTVLNAAGADAGVGGVTITYYAVPAASFNGTSQTTLRASAAAGTAFTSVTQLAETTTSTDYVLVVEVKDALGNRYFKGNATDLSFGVDLTAPTISVVSASSAADGAINPATMNIRFAVTDENSGAEGVRGTTQGRSVFEYDADTGEELRCYNFAGANVALVSGACATQSQTTVVATVNVTTEHYDVAIPGEENFYTITVNAFDAAGNTSTTTITRTALVDVTAGPDAGTGLATVTISTVTIDNTNYTASITGTVRDNIEVAFSDARFQFPGLTSSNAIDVPDEVPFTTPAAVGTYGLPLTAQQTVSATTQVNVDAIHPTPAGAGVAPTQFGFGMTDVAGNFAFGGTGITAGATNGFAATFTAFDMLRSPTTIDRTPPSGGSQTTTLSARATTGPGDANPFAGGQVYFYYVNPGGDFTYGTADDSNVLVGIVPAGTVSIATGETARTYTWNQSLSALNVPVLPAGFALRVFAIGVASDGDAVMTDVNTVTVNQ